MKQPQSPRLNYQRQGKQKLITQIRDLEIENLKLKKEIDITNLKLKYPLKHQNYLVARPQRTHSSYIFYIPTNYSDAFNINPNHYYKVYFEEIK